MTESESTIRVPGLSRIDALELRENVAGEAVRTEEEPVPEDAIGEIGLVIAVITATAAGLRALAAYFDSRTKGAVVREEIEIESPGQTRVRRTIEVSGESGKSRTE